MASVLAVPAELSLREVTRRLYDFELEAAASNSLWWWIAGFLTGALCCLLLCLARSKVYRCRHKRASIHPQERTEAASRKTDIPELNLVPAGNLLGSLEKAESLKSEVTRTEETCSTESPGLDHQESGISSSLETWELRSSSTEASCELGRDSTEAWRPRTPRTVYCHAVKDNSPKMCQARGRPPVPMSDEALNPLHRETSAPKPEWSTGHISSTPSENSQRDLTSAPKPEWSTGRISSTPSEWSHSSPRNTHL
mmetsp:Transcript_74968/g.124528  ORF Transcript_74968/g.124528 Transcript_74968/m.124528 type:complete len:254 (+) Transcript_74968:36-797(+)